MLHAARLRVRNSYPCMVSFNVSDTDTGIDTGSHFYLFSYLFQMTFLSLSSKMSGNEHILVDFFWVISGNRGEYYQPVCRGRFFVADTTRSWWSSPRRLSGEHRLWDSS